MDCTEVSHSMSHIPKHALTPTSATDRIDMLYTPVYWQGEKHKMWPYKYTEKNDHGPISTQVQTERVLEMFHNGAPPTLADSPNYYGPYNFQTSQRKLPYIARANPEHSTPQH